MVNDTTRNGYDVQGKRSVARAVRGRGTVEQWLRARLPRRVWETFCGFPNRKPWAASLDRKFAHHMNFWGKMLCYELPQQLLIVTFADMQTAERPEMVKVKLCKTAPITKLAVGKHLR
ncbi:MAG: hypothetical protein OHK0022_30340 [Roseiflexaceae bacterium]